MKGLRTRCNRFLSWRFLGMLAMVVVLATAAACGDEEESPTPTETPDAEATATAAPPTPRPPTPPPTPRPPTPPPPISTPPISPPTVAPPPLPTPPAMERQTEELLLEVQSPLNDSVVTGNLLQVSGRASPGASVSVNGRMASRGQEGTFTIDVNLVEGPNLVEVIASDLSGDQKEAIFLVVYAP